MFCQKCGAEIIEGALFCQKCGAKITEGATLIHNCGTKEANEDTIQQPMGAATPIVESQQGVGAAESTIAEEAQRPSSANAARVKKDAAMHKTARIGRVLFVGALALLFLTSFWNVPFVVDVIFVAAAAVGLVLLAIGERRPLPLVVGVFLLAAVIVIPILTSGGIGDKYIQIVKNGTLNTYPQKTVGEAFDGYLDNPKWESGLSEDKQRFVNVKGGILYYEKEAEIVVQFLVNEEYDSFQYNACEINGFSQNDLIVWRLFENIYGTEWAAEQSQADFKEFQPIQKNFKEEIKSKSAPNTPVYDVDELGSLLDTRSVYLYDEGGLLYGKYEQCENLNGDGKFGISCGDLIIWSSEDSESIVEILTTNPKTFQKNGITLNKNEEELIALLGVAEFDGMNQGIYYMTFLCDGYSLSFKFNDPAEAPYEIIVHF